MNFIDNVIGMISPKWGLSRTQHKIALDATREFLDAARKNKGGEAWMTIGTDNPNDIFRSDGAFVRDRAKWLSENDPYVAGMIKTLVASVIGTGINTQTQIRFGKSVEVNDKRNSEIEEWKKQWDFEADAEGKMHRDEMQELILKTLAVQGEVILNKKFSTDPKRVSPLSYEIISADRLSQFGTHPDKGNEVCNGIEYAVDSNIPVAYHIEFGQFRVRSQRILAENIHHIYRHDMPGQLRGISWLAPVIPDAWILHEVKEFALIARKVQSAIAVIVSDNPNGVGSGATVPGLSTPTGTSKDNNNNDAQTFIQPAMIHHVGSGSVHSHIPAPTNDLDPLTRLLLRSIGIGFAMSYERTSGDYERTNFAGGRLGEQGQRSKTLVVHNFIVHKSEEKIHKDFIDSLILNGKLRGTSNLNPYAAKFSLPVNRGGVNPLQDINAAVTAVENTLSSKRDEVENFGKDWSDVFTQRQAERKLEQAADAALNLDNDGEE